MLMSLIWLSETRLVRLAILMHFRILNFEF